MWRVRETYITLEPYSLSTYCQVPQLALGAILGTHEYNADFADFEARYEKLQRHDSIFLMERERFFSSVVLVIFNIYNNNTF